MIKKVRIAVDHGNRNMKTCSQVFTTVIIGFLIKEIKRMMIGFLSLLYLQS